MYYPKKQTLTAARLAANRKNALKSAGPRTPLGRSHLARCGTKLECALE